MGVAQVDNTTENWRSNATSANIDDDTSTGDMNLFGTTSPLKRKRKPKASKGSAEEEEDESDLPKKKSKKPGKKVATKSEGKNSKDEVEKRLRRFRPAMPEAYKTLLERAQTQRMFVLTRNRDTSDPTKPSEVIELAGSTGNVYTITISHQPTCNCPYAKKGNECKHVVYILSRVLKAPAHLAYQRAFLTSELNEIFEKAPALPGEKAEEGEVKDHGRKEVDGECPICCVDFADTEGEGVVWCKSGCGNNLHSACFQRWAVQKRQSGGHVTCPFCRGPWESEGQEAGKGVVDKTQGTLKEGYVNVADQLGLSGLRDTSTYHSVWVRRERQAGRLPDEDPNAARW